MSFNKDIDKITEREVVNDFVERLYIGDNFKNPNYTGIVDYTVCDKIPIIDLKGAEPVFKFINFDGAEYASMLIYDSGFNNSRIICSISFIYFSYNIS